MYLHHMQDSADDPGQRSQSSDGGPPEYSSAVYPHSSAGHNAGFRARGDDGPQRYCFMGRPTARVSSCPEHCGDITLSLSSLRSWRSCNSRQSWRLRGTVR